MKSSYNSKPHGIMFHHFHGAGHLSSQGSISAEELEKIIEFIGRERILPAREWRERARAGALRDGDLCLSLDDSLKCQMDIALPVFERHGLTAFWFVYTSVVTGGIEPLEVYRSFRHNYFPSLDDFYEKFTSSLLDSPQAGRVRSALASFSPGTYMTAFPYLSHGDKVFRFLRDDVLGPEDYFNAMDAMMTRHGVMREELARGLWMNADELRRLADGGHVIGLHSHTHPTRLAELPPERQRDEYRRNQEILTAIVGECPDTVGHPCGSYSADTLAILAELGVFMGFRANMAQTDYGMLELPREDHANIMRMIRATAA